MLKPLLLLSICIAFLNFNLIESNFEQTVNNCEVYVGEDVIIPFWESYQIDGLVNYPASEIDELIWSHPDLLSCTDCLDPEVNTFEEVCITLTVNFSDGCSASDEICIFLQDCVVGPSFSENKIVSLSPQPVADSSTIELELVQTQFVRIETVENDEVTHTIYEHWLSAGPRIVPLDFSNLPSGDHNLRVYLYPEPLYISITKQ